MKESISTLIISLTQGIDVDMPVNLDILGLSTFAPLAPRPDHYGEAEEDAGQGSVLFPGL